MNSYTPLVLEPGEVAKVTRNGPFVFAERMQFLSLDQARILQRPPWSGPVESIQKTVAAFYGIDSEHMRSPWRHRSVAWPRQRAMWLAKTLTGKPWTALGRLFGDRDHSTIIQGCRAVTKRMAIDPEERIKMHHLLASLEHLRRPC